MANWAKLQEDLVGLPVAKRAKHGIHFQKGANEFVANFSGAPCHYQDGGIWKPIDTKLILLPDGFYGCAHSPVRVHSDGRVKVEGTDYLQRTELPSAKTGLADNDKLVREFSFGKQELRITEGGFRSEITLNRIPTLTEARKLVASESGTLSKEYLKSLTTATDANDNVHTFTTLTAFRTWLAAAKFPVVIDPDFSGQEQDRRIYGGGTGISFATARSTSVSQDTNMDVGVYIDVANRFVERLFMKFDTSTIGSGNTVTNVTMTLTCVTDYSSTDTDVQIVKYDWSAFDSNPTNATVRETAYDNCLSATSDDSIWRNTSGMNINTPYTSGNLSNEWINITGITHYGFRVKHDYDNTEPASSALVRLADASNGTSSYRPKLSVTYTAAGTFIPINMNGNMQNLAGGIRG